MSRVWQVLRSEPTKYGLLTLGLAVGIGLVLLNPLWVQYTPPFPMPRVLPPITAPVDGVFYLRNATSGYQWTTHDPLSLWFHPLLAVLLSLLPRAVPVQYWFWLLSLSFAAGALVLTYQVSQVLSNNTGLSARMLPLCLLMPGGLGIATGNAEIPTLFFTLALLLAVLRGQQISLIVACGAAAILTKPNALYMVPLLGVYVVSGWLAGTQCLWRNSLIAIGAILGAWLAWIGIVDWQAGEWGTYWQLRLSFSAYVAGDARSFFDRLAQAFLYTGDPREQIRYATALLIPLVNLWILGLTPLARERDRFALAAGNLTMLALSLITGNPNKIIVYTTTLPGYFVVHLLFIQRLVTGQPFLPWPLRIGGILGYTAYASAMLVVYILGTPLGWYY